MAIRAKDKWTNERTNEWITKDQRMYLRLLSFKLIVLLRNFTTNYCHGFTYQCEYLGSLCDGKLNKVTMCAYTWILFSYKSQWWKKKCCVELWPSSCITIFTLEYSKYFFFFYLDTRTPTIGAGGKCASVPPPQKKKKEKKFTSRPKKV